MESIIGIVGQFLGSGGAGVITGGVGALFGGVFKLLNRKDDRKEKDAERKHELVLLDRQAATDKAEREFELDKIETEHENEVELANTAGRWDSLQASYDLKITDSSCSQWVNNTKALFRPFLTTFLFIMTGIILYWLLNVTQEILSHTEVKDLVKYCVYSVVYTASTAGTWWFGDRAISAPNHK